MDPITQQVVLATAGAGAAGGGEPGLYVDDVFSTFLYEGTSSTQTIRNGIGLADGADILPGTELGGGYFAGFISQTANGNATHALIVAPASSGYNNQSSTNWKTSNTSTSGTSSLYDGAANTANMANADHPAANYCAGLSIGGYSDWYLPALYELEIAYYNLKPTTTSNNTNYGTNSYAVPQRGSNYTAGDPAQTSVAAFQTGGAEDFVGAYHWSSTEQSSTTAWRLDLGTGFQFNSDKTGNYRIRAFRKIAINDPLLDSYRVTSEGGLVWLKNRSGNLNHNFFDTERGAGNYLSSNNTASEILNTTRLSSFNSNGFSLGDDPITNSSGATFCSWTFRKAPGFFDVVTYTGDATSGRAISHNLGSAPGCIMIKRLDASSDWIVWHRSLDNSGSFYEELSLNSTAAASASSGRFPTTEPTSTTFFVNQYNPVNASGGTYVAYVFAHDDQSFGTNGNESIIKCGSYTGNSGTQEIDLGFEPQWLMIKNATDPDNLGNWIMVDVMRGWRASGTSGDSQSLCANLTTAEPVNSGRVKVTSQGFKFDNESNFDYNESPDTYIYMAIRRPHKPPTAATEVFTPDHLRKDYTTSGFGKSFYAGFPVDFALNPRGLNGTFPARLAYDRLRGDSFLRTNNTDAEDTSSNNLYWDSNVGWYESGATSSNDIAYMFRRAPGFFDVVAYTGDGTTGSFSHNLGVKPEFKIIKNRDEIKNWIAGGEILGDRDNYIHLNLADSQVTIGNYWDVIDTTTTFGVRANNGYSGGTGVDYIAYLFATLNGISKVGTYSGTGNNIDVDCGFTAGARFVLIKRTDSTGDWYVWDTERGIVSGNDPYLLINSDVAEVTTTDYIDPLNAGFTVTSTAPDALNASGGTYFFLAIA